MEVVVLCPSSGPSFYHELHLPESTTALLAAGCALQFGYIYFSIVSLWKYQYFRRPCPDEMERAGNTGYQKNAHLNLLLK